MTKLIDPLMMAIVISGLMLLGSSRMGKCIRMVSFQGFLLGLLPVAVHGENLSLHLLLLALGSMAVKGVLFPRLLFRAIRETSIQREVSPFIGYTFSVVAGALMLAGALGLSRHLPLPPVAGSDTVLPGAFFMIMAGLFLIISRKTTISQVLGYLVLENGVFVFGAALIKNQPFMIELGILLDVFVGVFIMGIMIFQINREFEHIDVGSLVSLKETDQ